MDVGWIERDCSSTSLRRSARWNQVTVLQLAALCVFMVNGISGVGWMTTNVSGEYGSCVLEGAINATEAMINATNTNTSQWE